MAPGAAIVSRATLLQPGSIVTFWDESGRLLKACQEGKYWQLYPVEDGDGPATPEGAVKVRIVRTLRASGVRSRRGCEHHIRLT